MTVESSQPCHGFFSEVQLDTKITHDILTNDHIISVKAIGSINMEFPFNAFVFVELGERKLCFAFLCGLGNASFCLPLYGCNFLKTKICCICEERLIQNFQNEVTL